MKKVIVTGPTGIIGVALIKYCIQRDIEVLAVVRPDSKNLSRLPTPSKNLEIVECDLADIARLPSMIEGRYDVFYHLGWAAKGRLARKDAILQSHDISFTLEAVKAAKNLGCDTFVGTGTQKEYGKINCSIAPDIPINPDTPYGVAKFAAGKLSGLLCSDLGIRHIWARLFSIYGPNDSPDSMIMYVIAKLLFAEKPSLTRCEQYWDYLYCSDAARALYLLGIYGRNNHSYNVGSGHARPLYEYVFLLRDMLDPSLPLGIGERKYSPDQFMFLCADIDNLTRDTGFRPEISFEEGMRRTIEWYRNLKRV